MEEASLLVILLIATIGRLLDGGESADSDESRDMTSICHTLLESIHSG